MTYMAAYFDSSILISILVNDRHANQASQLWDQHRLRVSSILLEVECLTIMRRAGPKLRQPVSGEIIQRYLESVETKEVDRSIIDSINQNPKIAGCRSLDAIHVATALLFKANSDDPFFLITFDKRMAQAAKDVGLEILGH